MPTHGAGVRAVNLETKMSGKGTDGCCRCQLCGLDRTEITRRIGGSRDKTVKLWEWATGNNTATLKGHTDFVWSVAFNSDG
jgi:WD40 repeat protein